MEMIFSFYAAHTPELTQRRCVFDMHSLEEALHKDLKKNILTHDPVEQQMILIMAAEQKDENFLYQHIALITDETSEPILNALSQKNPSPHFISTLLLHLKDRWDLRTRYFFHATKQAQRVMINQALRQKATLFLETHATEVAQLPPNPKPFKRGREQIPFLKLSR